MNFLMEAYLFLLKINKTQKIKMSTKTEIVVEYSEDTKEINKIHKYLISDDDFIILLTFEGLKDIQINCKYYDSKRDYRLIKEVSRLKYRNKYICPDVSKIKQVDLYTYFKSMLTNTDYHISDIYDNFIRNEIKEKQKRFFNNPILDIDETLKKVMINRYVYDYLFDYSCNFLKKLLINGRKNNLADKLIDNFTKEEIKLLFSLALINYDRFEISFSSLISLIIKFLKSERDNINFLPYTVFNRSIDDDYVEIISETLIKFKEFDNFIYNQLINDEDMIILSPIINGWCKPLFKIKHTVIKEDKIKYSHDYYEILNALENKYKKILDNFIKVLSFVYNVAFNIECNKKSKKSNLKIKKRQ